MFILLLCTIIFIVLDVYDDLLSRVLSYVMYSVIVVFVRNGGYIVRDELVLKREDVPSGVGTGIFRRAYRILCFISAAPVQYVMVTP
jgi:hypothetical protein